MTEKQFANYLNTLPADVRPLAEELHGILVQTGRWNASECRSHTRTMIGTFPAVDETAHYRCE